jgi:hypothetical protein
MDTETSKLQSGCLVLPKVAPWLDDFMVEYLAFNGGKHDDLIDALSQFLNWRTEVDGRRDPFEFYFDHNSAVGAYEARLGAPSPEELLGLFGR